jgi:cyclopropane-fatty-acyl-phospholipid synthase
VHAVGITRSESQRALCVARLNELGCSEHVEVRLQDYREVADEPFDRVVSVGMLEHVGRPYLATYVATLARTLRLGGVGVLQWISKDKPGEVTPWILLRIFPGMYLPTLAEIGTALAANNLRLLDAENLRPHYALTLDAWAARLDAQRERVEAMYGVSFVRMWRMYLNAASVAFKVGDLNLWQIRFANGLGEALPLTRRHWYQAIH